MGKLRALALCVMTVGAAALAQYYPYYPGYVYPYPYAPPPAYYVPPPPTVIYTPPVAPSGVAPPSSWYYCDDPKGYYPNVPNCNVQWRQVPATAAAPPAK